MISSDSEEDEDYVDGVGQVEVDDDDDADDDSLSSDASVNDDSDDDSDGGSVAGLEGTFYGGYGRCYRCGKMSAFFFVQFVLLKFFLPVFFH